jgi:hypothetical protein
LISVKAPDRAPRIPWSPGEPGVWDEALGINDPGDVVGVHYDPYWSSVAVRWSARDDGPASRLPFPGTWSAAFKVNEDGLAVGAYGSDTILEDVAVVRLH